MKKPILCPGRIREVPSQFSGVDHRLVRERHISGKSPSALGLYLFLCTVADAQGLSYYSDPTIGKTARLWSGQLEGARRELIAGGRGLPATVLSGFEFGPGQRRKASSRAEQWPNPIGGANLGKDPQVVRIDYQTYCQIRLYHGRNLGVNSRHPP